MEPGDRHVRDVAWSSTPQYCLRHFMNTKPSRTEDESPARRLEILYMASLSAIALLLMISQAFILWELSWQKTTVRLIGPALKKRSLDRSLILSALAVSGAGERGIGRKELEALRQGVALCKADALRAHRRVADAAHPGVDQVLDGADPHRL